ncbi:MAG: transglycosylase domain-containing protein, partial [Thermoanaerobaculum sp.]|nr:transglycosylase domain-containing protein [Thermoanaerobaculum sp.]
MPLPRASRIALRWLFLFTALALLSLALLAFWGAELVTQGMRQALANPGGTRFFATAGTLRWGEGWTYDELRQFFSAHGLPPRPCGSLPLYGVCQEGDRLLVGPGLVPLGSVTLVPTPQGLRLQGPDGPVMELSLPPRLVALAPQGEVAQWPVALEHMSAHLVNAVVDLEDRGFLTHPGLSLRGLVRASVVNLLSGGVKQGGSTITQQVVKVLLLRSERRVSRKLLEAYLASLVEYRFSKREILQVYMNSAYFGQDGGISIHGVEAASRFYFGKPSRFLDLEEAALLAGMIAAPNRYNPFDHPEGARQRRAAALNSMVREGHLSESAARQAHQKPLPAAPWSLRWEVASHFLDQLRGQAGEVVTTLDPVVQMAVWEGVRAGLARLAKVTPLATLDLEDPLQVAVVVLGRGGRVLALQGSRAG